MPGNPRPAAQEQLIRLYLRLNGYFYSGFIAHSTDSGCVITELDTLAVRFPRHAEPEREIRDDPYLKPSRTYLDLVICEAKSGGQVPEFNQALGTSSDAVGSVLRRAGMFSTREIRALVRPVMEMLAASVPPKPSFIPRAYAPEILSLRKIRIRGFLFSPERLTPQPNEPWFIGEKQLFRFITSCLRPSQLRPTCADNYGAGQWAEMAEMVRYFKQLPRGSVGTITGLYAAMKI